MYECKDVLQKLRSDGETHVYEYLVFMCPLQFTYVRMHIYGRGRKKLM